jgi:hemerythrin
MAFINWSKDFSVGSQEIDSQHQTLVAMINKLHDAMKVGKASAEAGNIIKEMIDYSKFHFDSEEKLMKQINYPGINEHIKEHKAFMDQAHEFAKQMETGSLSVGIQVANFLKDWLSNHILVNDKAYSPFIAK